MTAVSFQPSATAPFSFQATFDGAIYTVTVTWNLFGQRYYVNCYDLSQNLVFSVPLVGSGPAVQLGSLVCDPQGNTSATLLQAPVTVPVPLPFGAIVFSGKIYTSARGTTATYLDGLGNLQQAQANQARPQYSGPTLIGVLNEAASENYITNPYFTGATPGVMGSGGVAPTTMAIGNYGSGITATIVGTGAEDNVPYIDLKVSGTSTSLIYPGISLGATFAGIPVTPGTAYTISAYLKVVGGALAPGQNAFVQVNEFTSSTVFVDSKSLSVSVINSGNLSAQQFYFSTTANTTVAKAQGSVTISCPTGTAVNLTLRIGGPQLELGASPTTLILPPYNTVAASTRAADALTTSPVPPPPQPSPIPYPPLSYRTGQTVRLSVVGASPAGYNGTFLALVTGPTTFVYVVDTPVSTAASLPGQASFDVNLAGGYFASKLVYRTGSSQFEVTP